MLSHVRGLLGCLQTVRAIQEVYDAQRLRHHTHHASHVRVFKRSLDPTVALDADTVFLGCLREALYGTPRAWVASGELPCDRRVPCEACGGDAWGLTCCPPRWDRRGVMRRDHTDTVVAFCWACLARRDLTHNAPQNWV